MHRNDFSSYLTCILILFIPHLSTADSNLEYEEINYQGILNELSKQQERPNEQVHPFQYVDIHTSLGTVNSINHISAKKDFYSFNRGIQFTLGVDLFSKNWLTEGSVLSYYRSHVADKIVSLKEFDIQFIYKKRFRSWALKSGLGLAARYMDIYDQKIEIEHHYSTPAYLMSMNSELYLTANMGVSADLSWRSAIIRETADKNSLNLSFRLNTHF